MIHRIDVSRRDGIDPAGLSVAKQIHELGFSVGPVHTRRIYLIDSDADLETIRAAARALLCDPIVEQLHEPFSTNNQFIEVHPKPGVMDPVAASTEQALKDRGLEIRAVRTGRAYLFDQAQERSTLEQIASRALANGVVESVHFVPFLPEFFAQGQAHPLEIKHLPLLNRDDAQLKKLSREGHLFLSLEEMHAVRDYFRIEQREPTDIELETIAQTWSEHCVHKTLKSAVDVVDESGKVIRSYKNLIGETIFASTMELMKQPELGNWCLSVFKDNAGVVAFDEADAICFKAETHNHPSALEPYGGSATGAGGVIRDVLGTGRAAKPIANTDVFCVAFPESSADLIPRGVIHPRRVLQQVVAGVRDYGNRMGIPTVNGAVYFDDRYIGNPLVFCGCVGLIPRDKIEKQTQSGDAIVVMGGRTGRDGIHGATFSSAELTDTHADEFSHAVQIGNAITEKKLADVLLAARDRDLFTSVTDCGAGGLSSAIGEMGANVGARVELDRVLLKYAGLRYDEIWISEAQERMVLSVPQEKVDALLTLAESEGVEATTIGTFGTDDAQLQLYFGETKVGQLAMHFLHDGLPKSRRVARVTGLPLSRQPSPGVPGVEVTTGERLLGLLSHPNIASKHWIIRQYDHEVQGRTVIKPLIGPHQRGPSDAAVLRPKSSSWKGIALGCGLAPHIIDPYPMALAAIDEAIRNVVAVGADPKQIALLDNFCWPSVDDEQTMGTLVRACEACRDAALAYGTPFISGKDSLHNQFTDAATGKVIRIPNTLLISTLGVVPDVRRCVTMDLKRMGHPLYLLRPQNESIPSRVRVHRRLHEMMQNGVILACHDVSDGGPLVAIAEMSIASGIGADVRLSLSEAFEEMIGSYVVEVAAPSKFLMIDELVLQEIGQTIERAEFIFSPSDESHSAKHRFTLGIVEMTQAWHSPLDW